MTFCILQDEDDKEDFNAAYAAPRMFLTFKSMSVLLSSQYYEWKTIVLWIYMKYCISRNFREI